MSVQVWPLAEDCAPMELSEDCTLMELAENELLWGTELWWRTAHDGTGGEN